jgi:hypothetical protein
MFWDLGNIFPAEGAYNGGYVASMLRLTLIRPREI